MSKVSFEIQKLFFLDKSLSFPCDERASQSSAIGEKERRCPKWTDENEYRFSLTDLAWVIPGEVAIVRLSEMEENVHISIIC